MSKEIKPVAWATEYAPGKYGVTDSRTKSDDDVPLVYIPATHRIVPVELLQALHDGLSVYTPPEVDKQLRAIIDKEPT